MQSTEVANMHRYRWGAAPVLLLEPTHVAAAARIARIVERYTGDVKVVFDATNLIHDFDGKRVRQPSFDGGGQ